jgi:hypothetical protein
MTTAPSDEQIRTLHALLKKIDADIDRIREHRYVEISDEVSEDLQEIQGLVGDALYALGGGT